MAWGRRCDTGCESWPDLERYETCPYCGESTTRFSNLTPLDVHEAHSIQAHIDFEAYYELHCAKHGYGVEGPIPREPLVFRGALGAASL